MPALADHILAQGQPHEAIVLVPSLRNARSLAQVLREKAPNAALVLPRIEALSHVESLLVDAAPAPPIPTHARLLLLTQLIQAQLRTSYVHAASLAEAMAALMDECEREGVDVQAVAGLDAGPYAEHWQRMLQSLAIVLHHWPKLLAERGESNPVAYRNSVLHALRAQWEEAPPDVPIIAAGSTASTPATAALLETIARLPNGRVILPLGTIEADAPPTHPQYFLARFIARLGEQPTPLQHATSARSQWLDAAFAAPRVMAQWQSSALPMREAMVGVHMVAVADEAEEARELSLRISAALEDAAVRVVVATASPLRSRLVEAELAQLGVEANSAFGDAVVHTPAAAFLALLLQASGDDALPLRLALSKHPLTHAGEGRGAWLARVREAEMAHRQRKASAWPELPLLKEARKPWQEWISEHLRVAETICAREHLWAGESGQWLAAQLKPWISHASSHPLSLAEYAQSFSQLLRQLEYRSAQQQHARVRILTPQEARLEVADVMVVMGCIEGEMPPAPPVNPWLSEAHKRALGFAPSEVRISRMAHDVVMLLHAPTVIVSHTRSSGGRVATPSRFLRRMQLLGECQNAALVAEHMARPDYPFAGACEPPAPAPALSVRPTRLTVSECEWLQRDAYAVYAKHVLKLSPLETLDVPADARVFGNAVHKALELWALGAAPPDACEKALAPYVAASVYNAWKQRVMRILQEAQALGREYKITPEKTLNANFAALELRTRVDRIEHHAAGEVLVADYKTGSLPKARDINDGTACQLPIMAWMAEAALGVKVKGLEYWNASGREILAPKAIDKTAQDGLHIVEQLYQRFYEQLAPYTPQKDADASKSAYAHLERIKEWG